MSLAIVVATVCLETVIGAAWGVLELRRMRRTGCTRSTTFRSLRNAQN